jgi:hypothetical protein
MDLGLRGKCAVVTGAGGLWDTVKDANPTLYAAVPVSATTSSR